MICPNCRRQMGDKLACDFCGFKFRVPKENSLADKYEPDDSIDNFFEESTVFEAHIPDAEPDTEFFAEDLPAHEDKFEAQEPPRTPMPSYIPKAGYTTPRPRPVSAVKRETDLEKPLSIGEYVSMFLLAAIPIVSLVMCIVWACSSRSKSRVHFAIALLILRAVAIMFLIGSFVGYLLMNGSWLMFWLM